MRQNNLSLILDEMIELGERAPVERGAQIEGETLGKMTVASSERAATLSLSQSHLHLIKHIMKERHSSIINRVTQRLAGFRDRDNGSAKINESTMGDKVGANLD